MRKKLFTFLLAIVASVGTLFAESSGTCGANLTWILSDDGVLTISGTGAMTDYSSSAPWYSSRSSITSVIISDGVTSIGNYAFYVCSSLTSVTIPNSVTSIGDDAFSNCSSLTSIEIPNSVTSIGEGAFVWCSSLTSVTIPNSVTSIGSEAFSYCSNLTSVTIPNSVTSIGNRAFEGCRSLTSVTIPNSVTSIGYEAFAYCSSLTSVTIPNSVTSIGSRAFYRCSSLTSVTIGNSVTSIGDGAFLECISLTSVTIPNSVTSIGNSAFSGCSSLTSVTIPNSVTSIGEWAFGVCSSLTSVEIPNSVTSIGYSAFYGVSNIMYNGTATGSPWDAKCLNGYVEGYLVFSDESKANIVSCSASAIEIVIPNSVTSIGDYAFYECSSLTSVTIPNSVTSIGGHVFDGCSGLTSVTIPNSVTSIGSSAFSGCSSLTSVTIGNSVTSIGSSAFSGCSNLTSVTIGNSVTSIGDETFKNCSNITSVVWNAKNCKGWNFGSQVTSFIFGNEVEVIPASLCSGMNKLTSVTIPNSVTSIGSSAFYRCSSLTSVTIPNSVTSIGNAAFYYCRGLTSVTIPNSVTSIGYEAFTGCSGLTSVTLNSNTIVGKDYEYNSNIKSIFGEQVTEYILGDEITSIGSEAFHNCSSLTSVTIGNSVTSIGWAAFYGCSSLTSVTIPNSVTSIGYEAFYGCSSLPVIDNLRYADTYLVEAIDKTLSTYTIKEGTRWIGSYAFKNCRSLTSVTIPNSVTSIGREAFCNCSGLASIVIPENVTSIGEYAFGYRNLDYQSNLIPNVEYHGKATGAPWGAKCVNGFVDGNLVYSDSAKKIIAACWSLASSVEIPNSVTSIGNSAFSVCSSLTSITLPNSVTSIGNSAFYDCSSLTSVTIPNSVTKIGDEAFVNCHSLTSIVIPNSVTNIGKYAFYNCSALSKIFSLRQTPPSIYDNTFFAISSDAVVYVPSSALNAYKSTNTFNGWRNMNIHGGGDFETIESPTSVIINAFEFIWQLTEKYIVSVGIKGGEQEAGSTLEYIGLEPNSEYKDVPVVLTSNTGETETVNVTFTTTALTLTTQQPKVVSSTTAILLAETNMSDVEVNCGFEWKRENAPDAMAGTKVYCPVANGTMAGRLKGLKDDVYYKYRAFYQSTAGNTHYGDWQYIFTGDDAVEFDPVMYTYAASAVTETEATLKGYALAGSDEFTEQGFEYWAESRVIPEGANHAPARAYQNAIGEHQSVQATGISMKVTLTNLDEGTVYKYRTYAVVNGAKVYGSEMSFTTRGEYLYTVTFVDYDGTILGSDKVHYGTAATAPEDPSRDGYSFAGWDKDYSNVTDDLIVTAQYTVSTALPEVTTDSSVQKFIRDGQLFIQKSGKTYTIQGVEVK